MKNTHMKYSYLPQEYPVAVDIAALIVISLSPKKIGEHLWRHLDRPCRGVEEVSRHMSQGRGRGRTALRRGLATFAQGPLPDK